MDICSFSLLTSLYNRSCLDYDVVVVYCSMYHDYSLLMYFLVSCSLQYHGNDIVLIAFVAYYFFILSFYVLLKPLRSVGAVLSWVWSFISFLLCSSFHNLIRWMLDENFCSYFFL